ncbi:MAG: isoaspartyl peptidase/L-asparaginase family protein [Nitrospiraceae bacterium]|nr:isoaspartyl peptidase/L-asparaginase family protein [Nitrospirota bacterium]MDA8340130.1 isoaspartyl peptidase/L-asparaginase family protein [Nitrospiraceae bacterium]
MLLIVHGGAGERKPTGKALKKLSVSLSSGYEILDNSGTALDAVVKSISILEDSGLFNAGSGGNLQFDGVRRLDASLIEGRDLKTGSVIGIEGIKNPIKLTRIIMDLPHVMLTNVGAKKIADAHNLEPLPKPDRDSLEILKKIKKKEKEMVRIYKKYFSTVGAVALDKYGNLAAGSSTGGIAAMLPGRVGDTPIIGAGTYAENSFGAVSCTGKGEFIIRLSLAKEICMNLKRMSPLKAAQFSLKRLSKIGGKAGVIVINKKGRFAILHSTKYMASGYVNEKGIVVKEGVRLAT